MKFLLELQLWLLVLVFSSRSLATASSYENCVVLDPITQARIYWNLSSNNLAVALSARSQGWIALGFALDDTMPNLPYGNDVAVGWVTTHGLCQRGCLYDMYTNGYEKPVRDDLRKTSLGQSGTQDVTLVSASEEGGVTRIEFVKNLSSLDPFDVSPSWFSVNKSINLVFASNELSDPFSEDGTWLQKHSTRAIVPVVLADKGYACDDTLPQENLFESPNKHYRAEWMLVNNARDIQVTIEARTAGWVGIGFSESPLMAKADMIVGWVNNEQQAIELIDGYAMHNEMPAEDVALSGHNDVSLLKGWEMHGRTHLTFRRRLVTQDAYDVPISDREIFLLWAYGSADGSVSSDGQRSYSQHVAHGVIKVNLVRGQVRDVSSITPLHGALMLLAYFALLGPAMFLARYLKRTLGPLWFRLHLGLVLAAIALLLAGLAVIVDAVSLGSLLSAPHQCLALLTLALTLVVQPLLGLIADRKWRLAMTRVRLSEEPSAPWRSTLWDKLHWWTARVLACLVLVTVILGISALESESEAWLYTIFVALVLTYATAIFVQERLAGQVTHAPADELNKESKSPTVLGWDRNRFVFATLLGFVALFVLILLSILVGPTIGKALSTTPLPTPEADLLASCSDCFSLTWRFPNYTVPVPETNYICLNFMFPVDQDYHIVKIEPLIDDPSLVHHISVYAVSRNYPDNFFECTMVRPEYQPYYIWFWGVGMPSFYYPPDTGFRVGKTGVRHALLQIHYNNPLYLATLVDSSGLKSIEIPPRTLNHTVTGRCSPGYSVKFIVHDITVFAYSFHMHTIGVNAYTQHLRNGKLIGYAGREDFYHFDAQRWNDIDRFVIKAGDELVTRCFYDSSNRGDVVKGGFRAVEEMCWNTLMYYPPLGMVMWDGNGMCLQ